MAKNEIVRADIFVIPNKAIQWEGSMAQKNAFDLGRWYAMQLMAGKNEICSRSRDFVHEKFAEVWFATPGNNQSNWSDHGIDGYSELEGWRPVVNRLPVRAFEGHKEGDVVTLEIPVEKEGFDMRFVKVALTLAQRKYRYREFGDFEMVVDMVAQ